METPLDSEQTQDGEGRRRENQIVNVMAIISVCFFQTETTKSSKPGMLDLCVFDVHDSVGK